MSEQHLVSKTIHLVEVAGGSMDSIIDGDLGDNKEQDHPVSPLLWQMISSTENVMDRSYIIHFTWIPSVNLVPISV